MVRPEATLWDDVPGVGLSCNTSRSEINFAITAFQALLKSGLTLVIYMGLSRAAEARDALLRAGMPGAMPVAVIANASRPEQTALIGPLDAFVDAARAAGIASPAIIVAGEVVSCSNLVPVVQAESRNSACYVGSGIGAP